MGGQQPISGAAVYVYAAGNSAQAGTYGTGATSLLTSAVLPASGGSGGVDNNGNYYATTNSGGYFSITGDYTCPAAVTSGSASYAADIYVVIVGGNSGGGNNAFSVVMAALGPCTAGHDLSSTVPFVVVNEVSTVAAVWALQQFMSAPTGVAGSFQIGTPTTNLVGLQNAFNMVPQLVNVASGQSAATIGTSYPEYDKINTVADILATCINSTDTASTCSNVFASVTPTSTMLGTSGIAASSFNAPADTVQAAWYLAQFPNNIGGTGSCGTTAAAFQCITATPPFTALSLVPNDWTIAVAFKPQSGGYNAVGSPFGVAIDNYGNAWLTNTTSSHPSNSVVELSPSGSVIMAPASTYTVGANSGYAAGLYSQYGITSAVQATRTFSSPRGIAVDSNGNVWAADWKGTPAVTISGGTFSCPGGDTCQFNTVAEFPASTGPGVGSTGTVNGFYTGPSPFAVAGDGNGYVYFSLAGGSTNYGSKLVAQLNASGSYTAGTGLGPFPYGIALDSDSTISSGPLIWLSNQKTCAVSTGYVGAVSQILVGSLAATGNSMVQGTTGCTSDVRSTFTAPTGAILGLATDASNNIWMVNSGYLLGSTTPGEVSVNTVTYAIPTPSSGTIATGAAASVTSSSGAGGLINPQYAAVDGAGNVWVSNNGAASISAFSVSGTGTTSMAINSLSGANGFIHSESGSAISGAEGIAIDPSGNVWVANNASNVNYVTVVLGVAEPVGPLIPGKIGITPSGSMPVISSFTESPSTINYGQSSSLSWTTVGATSVSLSGVSGTPTSPYSVSPTVTTYYTLTATNAAGYVTSTIPVILNAVGTTPATTISGMPRAQFFDYNIFNTSVYSGRVYSLWGAASLSQPSPVVPGHYIPYARDPNRSSVSTDSLAWYVANHPDWVVYQCDSNGNPLTPANSIYSTAYGYLYTSGSTTYINMPLDITNPSLRNYYFNTFVLPYIQAGWQEIDLDNIALTNWDSRCGVYNSSGTWVQQYAGSSNSTDAAYEAAVLSWIQWLTAQIHSYGVGVVGNLTFPQGRNTLLPIFTQLVNTVDMWIDEGGFTNHQDANINDAYWATKFNFIRTNSSRYYAPISKTTTGTSMISPTPSGYTAASQAQIDWSIANFLLVREVHTMLSVSGVNDFGSFVDNATMNINLGSPSAAPVQLTSGVWERVYTGGLVLVNPSSTVTGVAALGNSGSSSGYWKDTNGNIYNAGQISMSPNTGVMLMPY